MFEFFRKKKEVPEDRIGPKVPEDKQSMDKEKMRIISEVQSAREANARKIKEERKKMRPEVKEMYEKMIEEAKKKGDAKKQQIYEAALDELEKQISKDQEWKT